MLRGVLTRDALIAALQQRGGTTPVLEIMDRDVPTVPENACLDNVFQRLQGHARASSAWSTPVSAWSAISRPRTFRS